MMLLLAAVMAPLAVAPSILLAGGAWGFVHECKGQQHCVGRRGGKVGTGSIVGGREEGVTGSIVSGREEGVTSLVWSSEGTVTGVAVAVCRQGGNISGCCHHCCQRWTMTVVAPSLLLTGGSAAAVRCHHCCQVVLLKGDAAAAVAREMVGVAVGLVARRGGQQDDGRGRECYCCRS